MRNRNSASLSDATNSLPYTSSRPSVYAVMSSSATERFAIISTPDSATYIGLCMISTTAFCIRCSSVNTANIFIVRPQVDVSRLSLYILRPN